jgi:hypothetical protein
LLISAAGAVAAGGAVLAATRPELDVLAWRPGAPRAEVERELGSAGYRPIARGDDALLVATPVLVDLFAQQRTLVELDRGRLTAVSVHLLPEREDAGEALMDLYEEARRLLVGRLGAPSRSREEGRAVRGEILGALAAGRILRCLEWDGAWTVRLGIPRTASGQVRVELLLVAGELPAAESAWGREF